MKRLQGYLIDRETGAGISGKTVSFENLAGAAITTATTYAQAVDSVTDSDGKFDAWFELSPGPVNVQVDVSASEIKVRKHDEMAQFGAVWSSDIGRLGRVIPNGVIDGFLDELAVTTPSGHNVVVATGAAIIHGHVFSIENGPLTKVGSANNNAAIANRLDLVTLRQHHETASGQDSGRQEVVITEGTTTDVAPATPTGADFTDIPLAVISTAYLASTKTVSEDKRTMSNNLQPVFFEQTNEPNFGTTFPFNNNAGIPPSSGSYNTETFTITGLDPTLTYDGWAEIAVGFILTNGTEVNSAVNVALVSSAQVSAKKQKQEVRMVEAEDHADVARVRVLLRGVTGSSTHVVTFYGWHSDTSVSNVYATGDNNFQAVLFPRR